MNRPLQGNANPRVARGLVLSLRDSLTLTAALARRTGSQGWASIINESARNTIVGFYTNDSSSQSTNLMSNEARSDDVMDVQLEVASGKCLQTVKVGKLGINMTIVLDQPFEIDICLVSILYLDGIGFSCKLAHAVE